MPKLTSAFAVSVLVHLILFTVLALMPESHTALASKAIDQPLEVTFQTAPAAAPSPTPALQPATMIKTQLEPENLKQAERAPENATRQATHDSVAATPRRGRSAPAQASGTPPPVSAPRPDSPGLAVVAMRQSPTVAAPKGAPEGTGDTGEPGTDAVGVYGLAIDKALHASIWFLPRPSSLPSISIGEVVIEFAIDANGTASGIRVVSDDSGNPMNVKLAIRAIRETKFPAPSPEMLSRLPGGRKVFTRTFVVNP